MSDKKQATPASTGEQNETARKIREVEDVIKMALNDGERIAGLVGDVAEEDSKSAIKFHTDKIREIFDI